MSLYIDLKYLKLISTRLEGFTEKDKHLFATRCMYCGDSKKKKSKKRGYFYKKGNDLFYKCFNCEVSTTFYKVLEFLDPQLCKEYAFERFTNNETKQHNYKKPKFEFKKPEFKTNKNQKINLPSISSLDDNHYVKKYILSRKIPKGFHKDLYYAKDFKVFVSEIFPKYDKELIDFDERLIIPFRDENGNLFAFQGRALSKNPLRYITIKLNDNIKLFGLDRINKNEEIFVTEGPLDSLFLKNAVATADANLMIAEVLGKDKLVLINDNEPRNPQIVNQIKKYINNEFKICLLPEKFPGKDINEAIIAGLTKPQIYNIIKENTFHGMRALVEFNKWKKC